MTCEETQSQLDAYADGELGWGAALRVRHHLVGCGGCASELTQIRQLDNRIRGWRDVPIPIAFRSRIAAAHPPISSAASQRQPFPTRRAVVGLAGLAAVASVFLWLLPGQPGRPAIALADVEQAMQQVETLSWLKSSYYTDQYGNKTDQYGNKAKIEGTSPSYYTWLRRKPAAIASIYKSRGWRELTDKRGEIFQQTADNYQKYGIGAFREKDMSKRVDVLIKRMTQLPTDKMGLKSSGNTIISYTGNPRHAVSSPFHILRMPVQERQIEVNGRIQTLFTRVEDMTVATSIYPAPFNVIHIKQQIWADPITHRIAQVEIENSGGGLGPNLHSFVLFSDFHYNETPPPGVFDWSPPTGTIIRHGP
jgi:hypothetical protein